MFKDKTPVTPAVRFLRKEKVDFIGQLYDYEEHGGTSASARQLGVDEHIVIKTLVMEDENKKPMIVLMHRDLQVSTKNLARRLGVKSIAPCTPETATKHMVIWLAGLPPSVP